jgi:hypothetical protein
LLGRGKCYAITIPEPRLDAIFNSCPYLNSKSYASFNSRPYTFYDSKPKPYANKILLQLRIPVYIKHGWAVQHS